MLSDISQKDFQHTYFVLWVIEVPDYLRDAIITVRLFIPAFNNILEKGY